MDNIKVKSGKLIIVDPCYDAKDGVVINALNGTWTVTAGYNDEGVVAWINVIHSDYTNKVTDPCFFLSDFVVDSGQVGIFDYEYLMSHNDESRDSEDTDCFYGKACELTSGDVDYIMHGIIDQEGAVSATGYGDGEYSIFVDYEDSDHRTVVAVGITFADETSDDDYDYEEYDEYDDTEES